MPPSAPPFAHPAATLNADGRLYTPADLLAIPSSQADPILAETLDFCRAWLEGATSFALTTSGSTGAPKTIELTRRQMEAGALATAAALGLQAGDRALIALPTQFVAGRMMLVRTLLLGLRATLVAPAADPLSSLPTDQHFDFAAFVPLQMQTLLAGPADRRARLSAMRAILVGGAPIAPALADAIQTLVAPVYHTYGMTETATHIALRRLNGSPPDDHFTPLPGVETRVDDRGCLALRGPMTEHLWVQTNDLVDLSPDGRFRWLGRADLVVNTGGVKVPIEPLEEELALLLPRLMGQPMSDRRFLVVGLPDERLGQLLCLVVEGPPLSDGNSDRLLFSLRERLGPYRAPRRLLFLPRLPETPTGKLDRPAALAQLAESQQPSRSQPDLPLPSDPPPST